MPDNRRWTEGNDPSSLLDSPAESDVITGLVIFGVEAAYVFKSPSVKCHITTGDMLRDSIGKQNMAGAARCCCNTRLDPILRWRCDIRAAYSCIIPTYKCTD